VYHRLPARIDLPAGIAGNQHLPVGMKPDAAHLLVCFVVDQQRSIITRLPENNPAIITTGCRQGAGGAEGDVTYPVAVPGQGLKQRTILDAPERYCSIPSKNGRRLPIGAKGKAAYRAGIGRQTIVSRVGLGS